MSKSSRLGGVCGTFDASSTVIPPYRFVKTLHAVDLAGNGEGELVDGVSGDEASIANDPNGIPVWLRNAGGVFLIEMADSASAGDLIQAAENGQGTDADEGDFHVARLLEDASGAGSIVRAIWVNHQYVDEDTV